MPVFWLLEYEYWLTLSAISAVLQFIPIVGPSVLLAVLALYHATMGQLSLAVTVLIVGGVIIGWLPDGVIRPRLADHTTNLSGTLYFVGFVGGLLSMGVVGIIAGPLVVAIIAELVSQLAAELREPPPGDGGLPALSDESTTEE
jgi:predicted PurR-regulated permease PerM